MAPSVQRDGWVGTVLQDAFRLTRLIGQGGMGTVYEGTPLRLNRRVAVKLLARELASNDEALARFRREAEVTSQLGHPHIVQVFDFGTAPSGEPYLVMEFLEGEDLDSRLRRVGRLPLAAVVHIVRQIASALSSTHARGIVHRDLKPANIFLLEAEGETDFVKIVDFGISKVRAASTRITGASVVMGTPNYMAPEQASGQTEIDQATDQWSLACIVYELLAGRGPFVGDTVQSLLYQVVHQDPPALGALAPGLPGEVETAVRRALSKRQTDRFPSVNAFARALAGDASELGEAGRVAPTAQLPAGARLPSALADTSAVATAATDGPVRRWGGLLAALLATVAAIAVYRAKVGGTKPAPPVVSPVPPPVAHSPSPSAPGPAPAPAPSPPEHPATAAAESPVEDSRGAAPEARHQAHREGHHKKAKVNRQATAPAAERTTSAPAGGKRHLIEDL